jgi:hypothetical protein
LVDARNEQYTLGNPAGTWLGGVSIGDVKCRVVDTPAQLAFATAEVTVGVRGEAPQEQTVNDSEGR